MWVLSAELVLNLVLNLVSMDTKFSDVVSPQNVQYINRMT